MSLLSNVASRGAELARAAAQQALAAAESAAANFPDVTVRRDGDTVVLSGMGLVRRWLGDVRLRFGMRGYR